MISYSAKKSVLYEELDTIKRKEYFNFNQKSFLHNIDTLYYVIKIVGDWKNNSHAQSFINFLSEMQEKTYTATEVFEVFKEENLGHYYDLCKDIKSDWIMAGVAASKIYRYDLQQKDRFSVFIAHNTPNPDTPELIVQIRSQFLWLEGEKQAVIKSLNEIEAVLDVFNIKIKEVKENRIDYAYHTNYIQNPTSYFKHQNIAKMQQSRFSRGSIEFSFRNQWITETDYLTLGRKKSNNLFFRIYDKTKEVIQQQYKQFFIELWYQKKMISFFDKYCIEKAFMNPSADNFKYLDIARLEFYLEFGFDEVYKKEIRGLLSEKTRDYTSIIELADMLTPNVTKILNVELETKRKFYSTLDSIINSLLDVKSDVPKYADKLFRILDNKKLFHDFITRNTIDGSGIIRFIDYNAKNRFGVGWKHKRDYPTSDFWKRLQNVALDSDVPNIQLVREYQKNLSIHLMKKRLLNNISSFSLYQNGEIKNDPFTDALDFISTLNETDLEKANQYKENKYLLLKDRLHNIEASLTKEHDFKIIDMSTGELIASDSEKTIESVEYVDYSTNDEQEESFVIFSPEDILQSVILDLEKEKKEIERMLNNVTTNNEKFYLYRKLDVLNEKISRYKKN